PPRARSPVRRSITSPLVRRREEIRVEVLVEVEGVDDGAHGGPFLGVDANGVEPDALRVADALALRDGVVSQPPLEAVVVALVRRARLAVDDHAVGSDRADARA